MKLQSFLMVFRMRKTDEEKLEEIKKHIKTEYIPYEEKTDMARAIVRASCYTKDKDGREYFHVDSPARYMLTCMGMLDLFTTFERSKKEGAMLEQFNQLNSIGIFDLIVNAINPKELKEFNMLIQMVFDDIQANEYEPHAFIRNQVERFGTLIGTAFEPLLKELDVERIKELVSANGGG